MLVGVIDVFSVVAVVDFVVVAARSPAYSLLCAGRYLFYYCCWWCVVLLFLLLIDGNEAVNLAPLKAELLASFKADADQHKIDEELDVEAFIVLISSLSYGYALMRDSLADEFEIEPIELDWRIDALLEQLLQDGVEKA